MPSGGTGEKRWANWCDWLAFSALMTWYFIGMVPPEVSFGFGAVRVDFAMKALLFVAIGGLGLGKILARERIEVGGLQSWAFIAFVGMLFVASLDGVAIAPAASRDTAKVFLLWTAIPYLLTVNLLSSRRRLRLFLIIVSAVMTVACGIGVINSLMHAADVLNGIGGAGGFLYGRVAQNTLVFAPVVLWVISTGRRKWPTAARCLVFAMLIAAVALTRSRAGLIGSGVLLVGLLLHYGRKQVYVVCSGAAALVLILVILGPVEARLQEARVGLRQVGAALAGRETPPPQMHSSFMQRWHVWKGALKVVSGDVLTGVGPGGLRFAAGEILTGQETLAQITDEHNAFIQVLVASGVPGLLAFVCFLAVAVVKAIRIARHRPVVDAEMQMMAASLALGFLSGAVFFLSEHLALRSMVQVGPVYWRTSTDNSYIVLALIGALAVLWHKTYPRASGQSLHGETGAPAGSGHEA